MKYKLKKVLSLILAAAIIICSAPLTALTDIGFSSFGKLFSAKAETATSGTCGDNLAWTLDTQTCELVISGTGSMTDWVSSSSPWYSNREYIKSVTIENGVTSIGTSAFYDCSHLESVSIADSVTYINSNVFMACSSLETIIIPGNVSYIGDSAFWNCTALKNVVICNGVTSIHTNAFAYCSTLSSISIPASMTEIADSAFENCSSLSNIYYSGTESSWGEISIGENNTALTDAAIDYRSFTKDNITYSINEDSTVNVFKCDTAASGDIIIPSTVNGYIVKAISYEAFKNCNEINSITVSEGLTDIGSSAFCGCKKLETVTIGQGITTIPDSTFSGCIELKSISLPNTLKRIDSYAFKQCSSLLSIVLPDGLEHISGNAFYYCKFLTDITIPDSTTYIEADAFIYSGIYSDSNREDGVLYIGNHLIDADTSISGNYTVKNGTVTIAESAFENCTELSGIVLPETLKTIGALAFHCCTALTDVVIPQSVTYLADKAFLECTNLTCATLYDNLEHFGCNVFLRSSSTDTPDYATIKFYGTKSKWTELNISGEEYTVSFIKDISDAEPSGTNNILSYDELNAQYNNFVYVGLQVYEADGTISDHIVSPGDTLELRYYIKSDLYLGNMQLIETFDSSFFDVTSVGTDVTHNALGYTGVGTVTYNPNHPEYTSRPFTGKLLSNKAANHNALKSKSGLDEEYISSNDYVLNNIIATTSERTAPFYMRSDEWFVSYTVKVKDTVADGQKGTAESLPQIWKSSLLSGGTYNGSMPGNINCFLMDSAFSVVNCKPLNIAAEKGHIEHLIIGDTNHEFTAKIILPTVTWDIDGTKTVVEYEPGAPISIPVPTEKEYHTFVGWSAEIPETMPDDDVVFTAIYDFTGGSCGEKSTFEFDKESGTLSITGEGAITSSPWITYAKNLITSVEIAEGITSIPDGAFEDCFNLERVSLPASLTSIGNAAFTGCDSLENVYYGDDDEAWNSVAVGTGNDSLAATDIIYTYLPEELFTYTVANGEATITGYNTKAIIYGIITIPEKVEGCSVTAIGEKAFYEKADIISVTVPSCVKTIGVSAFAKCTALTSVTIAEGVESIGKTAFNGCKVLTEITLPEGIASIGSSAFMNCTSLTTVNVSSTVTSLTAGMFTGCPALTTITVSEDNPKYSSDENGVLFNKDKSILILYPVGKAETNYIIPDGVTEIGASAFKNAKMLESITVSEGVTTIGTTAFAVCTALTTVKLPISLTSISNGAFNGCSGITDVYYSGYQSSWSEITIGTSNDALTAAAFHCEYAPEEIFLYSVVDNTYVSINGCNESMLKNGVLNIPSEIEGYPVTHINNNAFQYCSAITEVTLPDSLTQIGYNAFYNKDSIVKVTFGNGLKTIYDDAFYDCDGLTSITIPDSVTAILNNAFEDCSNLTELTLGKGIYSIGNRAFYCPNLENVYYTGTVADWCDIFFNNYYGYHANPIFYADNLYIDGVLIEGDLVIPDTATAISGYAFCNYPKITSVTIPDSVTYIGDYAFYNCSGITNVIIGNGVTNIGRNAFSDCSNLSNVTLGSSVTEIEYSAFYNCTKLTSIKIPDSVTSIESSAFKNCSGLTNVEIGNNVTYIGNYSFYDCRNITEITISNSVETIDSYAFAQCDRLKSITIPDNVTSIGMCAFAYNSDMTTAHIGSGVTSIGERVFTVCPQLTEITVDADNPSYSSEDGVLFNKDKTILICYPENKPGSDYTIPDTVKAIETDAFYSCNNIVNLTIPVSVTAIKSSAFYSMSYVFTDVYYEGSLEDWCKIEFSDDGSTPMCSANNLYLGGTLLNDNVTIPESITEIGNYTFAFCDNIKEITFHNNVTSIGIYAFEDCDGLTSIKIPESITRIGFSAFNGCSYLAEITIPDKKIIIESDAFSLTAYSNNTNNRVDNGLYIGNHLINAYPVSDNFTVKDGTITVAENAIDNASVSSITLPSSLEYIGEFALGDPHTLDWILFEGTRSQWSEIDGILNYPYSVIYYDYSEEKEVNGLCYYINSKGNAVITSCLQYDSEAFEIPSMLGGTTVTEIADNAFYGCEFQEVVIPDSVTIIGEEAFAYCYYLQKITIPDSVEYIGALAFYNTYIDYVDYRGDLASWCSITFIGGYANPANQNSCLYINDEIVADDIIIPDGVTAIGDYAFYNNYLVQSVTIPDSVTSIGKSAFYRCYSLSGVTIGNGVAQIDDCAFSNCEDLTGITIPDSVTNIGEAAFEYCTNLSYISIGKGLENLAYDSFYGCNNLYKIIVSEENPYYTSINDVLFSKDKKELIIYPFSKYGTTFEIPAETDTINFKDLSRAYKLGNIKVHEDNQTFISIDGVLFSKDKTVLLAYPFNRNNNVYIIPDTATTIGSGAFCIRDNRLRQLGIPKTVTCLEEDAFTFHNNLERTYFSGTEAEWEALIKDMYSYYNFGSVYYNFGILTDDSGLIYAIGENSEATLIGYNHQPDGVLVIPSLVNGYPVTLIDSAVFRDCDNITELVVSEGIREICNDAFSDCGNLEKVTLADSVITIGATAFENCINLKEVKLSDKLETIGQYAFNCCSELTSISFPDSLNAIGASAFAYCEKIPSIILPDGLTAIGENAFLCCYSLTEVAIPDSVTFLGQNAFHSCHNLEYAEIGSGLTNIHTNTFSGTNLKTYKISPDNPQYSNDEHGVLFNKDKTQIISYPCGKTESKYEIPASVTQATAIAFHGCSNLKAITVNEENEHYASVDGVLFSKDLSALVFRPKGMNSNIFVIPDTVTTVLTGAIVTTDNFRYLSIPKTVTKFERMAINTVHSFRAIFFGGSSEEWQNLRNQNSEYISYNNIYYNSSADKDESCGFIYFVDEESKAHIISADESVKGDVVIPDTLGGCPVTSIGDEVFVMNDKLTNITIPDTVVSIGDEAFYMCINLESITLPSSLEKIGDEAFYCCVKLESVEIPASVKEIDFNAFADCINITEFTVEEGNEYFSTDENGVLLFMDERTVIQYPLNSPATDYVIPDTVEFVNFNGFINARNIKTLTIPASVTNYDVNNIIYIGLNFEQFIVDENSEIFSSDEQGALYSEDKKYLFCVPPAIRNKNFVIPDTVEQIYTYSFFGCKDMVITIPDGVSDDYDWTYLGSAKEYIVSENNPYFASHKGAIYNKDKTVLIKHPTDSDADIHIAPESFEAALEVAFINTDIQLLEGLKGLLFIDGFDSDTLISVSENLTLHVPVPAVTFGTKQICVAAADEEYIQEANEMMDEYREEFRAICDLYNHYLENEPITLIEKIFSETITKFYGKILSTADHITVCGGEHSDVHTHKWVETVVEETCTIDGSITVACAICDEATVTVIPACHKPGEWITVTEPTTKAEGKKEKYCTVCNETLEEEIIPKLNIPVTGIILKETKAEILNYTSLQLNASTIPEECNNTTILWSSSDKNVATVDENGFVKAVSYGTAIITATTQEGGFSAECVLTVTPVEFTVTLNTDGVKSVVNIKEGNVISIDNPVKEGYTFVKWTPAMPEIMPSENIEFTAVFEINTYNVEWNIDGLTMNEKYKYGESIDKTKTFTKKGYTFAGWAPEIPDTMPAEDLIFTAIWKANLYEAVFYTNGGTFPDGSSIKKIPTAYNTAIVEPAIPVKQGYEFAGWAYNGKNIGTDVGIMNSTEGKSFEAIWASNNSAKYKLETYTMNTVGEYEKMSITLNADVYDNVSATPDVETGFVLNEEKSVLNGTVTADGTLILKIYYDRLSYNLTFIVDSKQETVSYYYGAMISPPSSPVKDGFVFTGWDNEIPATMPSNDITVTATFKTKTEDKTSAKISFIKPQKRTLYYGESITLQLSVRNLPEGSVIKWYVEGDGVSIKPSKSGKTCKVTSTSNGNVIIRATVLDAKGNTVKGKDGKPVSDYEYLYSEVNLWQMIVSFFRSLFGTKA